MVLYALLKWIHILSAAVVVGLLVIQLRLEARRPRDPRIRAHVMTTLLGLHDVVMLPALGLLFVTGVTLVLGPFPAPDDVDRTGLWVWWGMGLWGGLVVVSAAYLRGLARLMRDEAGGDEGRVDRLWRAHRRGGALALALAGFAIAVMVLRPF